MNPLLMSIVIVVALTIFGRTMVGKIRLLTALEPTDRADHLKDRLMNMVILAIAWSEEKKKEAPA
jgi:cell shape-determining protein MreD